MYNKEVSKETNINNDIFQDHSIVHENFQEASHDHSCLFEVRG